MRFAACIVSLGACVQAHEKKPPPPEAATEAELPRAQAHQHVQHKLDLARATEMLLIRGELDAARPLARAIADEPSDPDDPWKRAVIRVRNEAAGIAYANTLDESLTAMGRLTKACAECHATSASPIAFSLPPQRADATAIDRHRWAADRLWEASISGRDDAWLAALDIFATGVITVTGDAQLETLQRIAVSTRAQWRDETIERRAEDYSELLAACMACHAELQRQYPSDRESSARPPKRSAWQRAAYRMHSDSPR